LIIARSDYEIPDAARQKIALFCDVKESAVIPLRTVQNIYEVPVILQEVGLGDLIINHLRLPAASTDMMDWRAMVDRMNNEEMEPLLIGIVGKYVDLRDSYISVRESLRHAGLHHERDVEVAWIASEDLEREGWEQALAALNGIVVPGGFGARGIEGMIRAAYYARVNQVPYLGLCLGMQVLVIEYARHIFESDAPNSTEFDPETPYPVIDILPEQRTIDELGGTMRLGGYPCVLTPGTIAGDAYATGQVMERHRHRYELNNVYREQLQEAGLRASGVSPDGKLVEISELAGHPFMLGTQFHPEFRSRPAGPHPLFREFVGAAAKALREGAQHKLPLSPMA